MTHFGPLRETAYRGSVLQSTDSQLHVMFPEPFPIDTKEPWRLDVGRSNIVFDRMVDAVSSMRYDPQNHVGKAWNDEMESFGFSEGPQGRSTSDRELIIQGTHLRDVLLRGFKDKPISPEYAIVDENEDHWKELDGLAEGDVQEEASAGGAQSKVDFAGLFQRDSRIISWARRYSELDPIEVEGDPMLSELNSTQIRAIAMMVNNRTCLVQGVCIVPGVLEARNLTKITTFLATRNGQIEDYYRGCQTSQSAPYPFRLCLPSSCLLFFLQDPFQHPLPNIALYLHEWRS